MVYAGQGGAIRLGISKALLAFIGSTEFGDILEKGKSNKSFHR